MKITGAEAIMRSLVAENVDLVFGYPGGTIMPAYDALYHYREKIRHVLVRHEQGAAHAAEGYARATGRTGVCIATSGPGATNLVTGIADAMMDSVPIVCITGQVGAKFLGTDAFQETDIISITMPITKWNYQVTNAKEIPAVLAKAFYIARTGRPGPVLVDITKNAQQESFEFEYNQVEHIESCPLPKAAEQEQLERAAKFINGARKPFMLLGHGILISNAAKEARAVAEKAGIPVACTLHGLSAFPWNHPLYTGMLGMHGNYGPNVMSKEADVIIAVGMRFDDRVTGDASKYALQAKVVHIDVDAAEISKNVKAVAPVVGDAKQALTALLPLLEARENQSWVDEFSRCAALEQEKVISGQLSPSGAMKMGEVIAALSERTKGEAIIVADVGQHQMMAARYYRFRHPRSFISSGGLGTMGFALPAAMGAKFACPDRQVVAVIGDGGFQMTLQEMATIAQEDLPVKVIVLNNNFLGMVRQWQELFFERRYSFVDLKNPDFIALSHAFGVNASRVSERSSLTSGLDALLNSPKAYLLEVVVEKEDNVFPMVPPAGAVTDIRLE